MHDRGKYHGHGVHRVDGDGGSDRWKPRAINKSVDMACGRIRASRDVGGMGASRQTGCEPCWGQRTLAADTCAVRRRIYHAEVKSLAEVRTNDGRAKMTDPDQHPRVVA